MSISRTKILRGPCQIQYGGETFYSKDDVVVALNAKTQNIVSSAIGLVDYRDDDFDATITFTPDGQVTDDLLAVLFPFIQSGIEPGTSVFGASDRPLQIYARDGYRHTFKNAAVTKQPQFMASAAKTAFGQITFTALRSDATPWSTANSLVIVEAVDYPGDSGYDLSSIITTPFQARWKTGAVPTGTITGTSNASPDVITTSAAHGLAVDDEIIISGVTGDTGVNGTVFVKTVPSSTTLTVAATKGGSAIAGTADYVSGGTFTRMDAFDSFDTESGFTIDTNVTLHDETSDSYGLIDKTFQQIEVTAKAVPIGPTPDDLFNAFGFQGAGAVRGRSRAAVGADLYLTGTGLFAKLTQASLIDMQPAKFGMATKRVGDVTWKSTMTLTDGAPNPPLSLSTSTIA